MTAFLRDGPADAPVRLLLAHGAAAPMDAPGLASLATALAAAGLSVARFEFGYMAARRSGTRRPPPRAETLIPEYRAAVEALGRGAPLVIGGKSMGGRVASMAADALHAEGRIAGLICLGYPFHPPDKPAQTRISHLAALATPAFIVQGTRDPFGTRAEVATYPLAPTITLDWIEDGDHDLKTRKSVTAATAADTLKAVATRIHAWATTL